MLNRAVEYTQGSHSILHYYKEPIMIKSSDIERLNNLLVAHPENEEQRIIKDKLIHELRLKLGIIEPEHSVMAVNGDLDDMISFGAKAGL